MPKLGFSDGLRGGKGVETQSNPHKKNRYLKITKHSAHRHSPSGSGDVRCFRFLMPKDC